jgi:ABC-type phosphate/phosphonate transport system substrate-binding protein
MKKSATETAHVQSIAEFPLYDFPQLRLETNAFWHAIAKRLRDAGVTAVPHRLSRSQDYAAAWRNPGLIMGQACGYPLMKQLKNRARIVATPIYTSRGCETFRHSSVFIVNANAEFGTLSDLRGRVCAVNGFDSNTGMNLLRAAIAPLAESKPFFHSVVVTGSHLASIEMIANGGADVAAIDCVTLAYLQRFESALTARVRQIGQSTLVPAPPFITTWKPEDRTLTVLRRALDDVTADPKLASVRTALTIGGFEYVAEADYEITLRIEQEAAAVGYPKLC